MVISDYFNSRQTVTYLQEMKGKGNNMKRKIIAAILALAFVAGAVPTSIEVQKSFTAEAAKKKEPTIKKLHNAIKDAYGENYVATMSLTNEEINQHYGLSSNWYTAAVSDMPMISAHIDTLVIVKAKNAKTKKKIKKKLQEYQEIQINDTMQYPMNLLKAQASRVYTKGNYVFFFMLGFIDNSIEETGTEEDQIAAYKEQNQIAVDTVKELFAQ